MPECIACRKEFIPVRTIEAVSTSDKKRYYPIDFCECGLGKTRFSTEAESVGDINKLLYDNLEERIKIYYNSLYNHFTVRYNEILKRISKFNEGKRLLECGSNIGFTANIARRYGYSVFGCELNERCRDLSQLLFPEINVSKDFFTIDGQFDIITMNDVLEHFPDPGLALKKALEILDINGILFIQLPNNESRVAEKLQGFWPWYGPPDHTYHFSIQSLKLLAENNFWSVEWYRTCDTFEDTNKYFLIPRTSKIIKLVYNNPFFHPGLFSARDNKGGLIQMIIRKK